MLDGHSQRSKNMELEQSLQEIVRAVCGTMLGLSVQNEPQPQLLTETERLFVATIDINGNWSGSIVLYGEAGVASEIAGALFGAPVSDMGLSEMRDAIGELANIIGGKVMASIPGEQSLSLPSVTVGAIEPVLADRGGILNSLYFRLGLGPMRIDLVQKRKNDIEETTDAIASGPYNIAGD